MTERPKPPEGYETWLDYLLRQRPDTDIYRIHVEQARTELAELRAEIERLRNVMRNPPWYPDCGCKGHTRVLPPCPVCKICLAKAAEGAL